MNIRKFYDISRIPLAPLDTPIESMKRLSATLTGGPHLFIKRDDFIGPLVWGNKLRKLEYSFARAKEMEADTIITCGAIQSNHARTTAMVASRIGLSCLLVLNGEEHKKPSGNYLISRLMGVDIKIVPSKDDREPEMERLAEELRSKGRKPFIIPLGASDENGTPGFVHAMFEIKKQQEDMGMRFNHIVVSSSSGGTQGGLEAGKRIAVMHNIKITGISADETAGVICDKVLKAANPILNMTGMTSMACGDLNVDDRFTGPGYGIPSADSERASDLFLSQEGILLDHTYTAKAAAGLIALAKEGYFNKDDNVLFWHTGGLVNLFS